MRGRQARSFGLVIGFILLAPPFAPAQSLEARLRLLEKDIAAARGLEFKAPVQAKVIHRPADQSKTVQGSYDPRAKTLFLYDDLADSYEKGVLIHEMVHALQDQHFDLEKLHVTLHQQNPDDDRAMALATLIEGDATFTMIEVLKKEQPKVAGMLEVPLEKAKRLQNAFLYAQGARYVRAVKDKGGWPAVNSAYQLPPRSTASILNLRGVSVVDLGPGKTVGSLALLETLAKKDVTRHEAVKLASAWRGGVVQTYSTGTATLFACQDDTHAALLAAALGKLHPEPAAMALARRSRVTLYEAADAAALKALRDAVEGPPALTVFSKKAGRLVSFGDMIDELLSADLVCIGEEHDSDVQHRVQLQIIKALHARDDRLGVGLEMFQKPFQKSVDRFFQGMSSEEEFLKESEYNERWGYDWSLYRPIVMFCRDNHLPLIALNAPKELTRRISKVGIASLDEKEKKELGAIDLDVKDHREHWYELLAKMHGNPKATPEQKERSYQVMATWDDFMAQTAVAFQQERAVRRLVLLAGGGHVNRGFGIPRRAVRYSGGKVLTIAMVGPGKVEEVHTDFQIRLQ